MFSNMPKFLFLILFLLPFSLMSQPVELGTVNWLRDWDAAKVQAQSSQKDIFILFQEVPGCSTCQKYGQYVMSDPLLKEIIETYYVPLAIYNNKGGKDKKALEYFNEPSWNNPVARIVNAHGKSVGGRLSGKYSKSAVLDFILSHLKQQTNIPAYINILENEWYAAEQGTKEVTLSMYCFWSGEKVLGQIPGVVNTTAGFMNGREVVKVSYLSEQTSAEKIVKVGKKHQCADQVFTNDKKIKNQLQKSKIPIRPTSKFKLDKDQNYYLKHSKFKDVQLTEMQAMMVNSALGEGKDPTFLLSPRQVQSLE